MARTTYFIFAATIGPIISITGVVMWVLIKKGIIRRPSSGKKSGRR